jgi:hypothetical protein
MILFGVIWETKARLYNNKTNLNQRNRVRHMVVG